MQASLELWMTFLKFEKANEENFEGESKAW
jgi:hypothetical protein